MDIRSVQEEAWRNKQAKGFNLTDVPLEFGLLTAEIGEAFTAWRKGLPDLGEELADILIFLVSVAEMTGVDLSAEVEVKLQKNAGRVYSRDERGVLRRVTSPETVRRTGAATASLPPSGRSAP
jgi:NTP pyrophosphatase (non-canonical NTP hydrolase)